MKQLVQNKFCNVSNLINPSLRKRSHMPTGAQSILNICTVDQDLNHQDLNMKPEHETRRKIIREWMSLPKDKRQTEEQAKPFAKKAMERIPSSGDPYRQIMRWLLPRIGKP